MGSGFSSGKKTSVPVRSSSVIDSSNDAAFAEALHVSELEARNTEEAQKAEQLEMDQRIAESLVTGAEVSHELPYNENEPEGGLTQEQIDQLPTFYYAGHGSHNNECDICYIAYKIDDLLRTLPCCHIFHSACIGNWIKKSNTCPMCHKSITEELNMLSPPPASTQRPLTPSAPPLDM